MGIRTPLAQVKGLGSAKHGTGHWWAQRVTSVALIPLSLWFVYFVICVAATGGDKFLLSLSSPFSALMMILFLGTSLYHGALGMQVVIEDYVHNEKAKIFLLLLVQYGSLITSAAVTLAIVTFHVNHVAIGG
ncbi:MAG: sdhD [Rickettsiales bacterium]|jgi:succinate dehydrogenase / fumarate reductase membrane anchor subunit|nr:sdhD [Rickettsiales bacterium]